MKTWLSFIALLIVAGAIGYALLRSARLWRLLWIGELTGSRLDIGPVNLATLTATQHERRAGLLGARCRMPSRTRSQDLRDGAGELLARLKTIGCPEPDTTELSCEPNCDRTARYLQHTG